MCNVRTRAIDFCSVTEPPPGAIKFPMVCYGRKRGTDDGFLQEVSFFLEEICSSLEVISFSLEAVSASLGRIPSFLEDVSSSTYHSSSGNHYGLVAKPVFGQITIHIMHLCDRFLSYTSSLVTSAKIKISNGMLWKEAGNG